MINPDLKLLVLTIISLLYMLIQLLSDLVTGERSTGSMMFNLVLLTFVIRSRMFSAANFKGKGRNYNYL